MSVVQDTLAELDKARAISRSVLVSYSDGKDARCVMDLATRTFDHVEAFFMYFVPGLECVDVMLKAASERWGGIKIHQYPHWITSRLLRDGVFCNTWYKREEVPEFKLAHVYALAMKDTGIPLVLTGAKKADGVWRRWVMANQKHHSVREPLANWNRYDVLAYLRARGIPLPNASDPRASGIGVSESNILWLYDLFPDDYARIKRFFPYVEATIKRREYYGIGNRYAARGPKQAEQEAVQGRRSAGEPPVVHHAKGSAQENYRRAVQPKAHDRRRKAEAEDGA